MTLRAAILAIALLTAPAHAGLVGWDTAAWPACEHVGSRELEPGLLYKQRWAADVFAAIEERRAVALRNGWGVDGAPTVPAWWTASGITNRVVAYERDVLVQAKTLTRHLAQYYLATGLVAPDNVIADWEAWAAPLRTITTNTITGADWTWGCPPTVHAGTDAQIISLGTVAFPPFYSLTAPTNAATAEATLEGPAGLPASALTWTPWRLWEGICDPASSYLGSSLVFRAAAVTGVCNYVTLGTATATTGTVTATVLYGDGPCIEANGAEQVVIQVTNAGASTATAVRVRYTLDNRLLLVSPYGSQAEAIPGFHTWRGAEVTADMGDLDPSETATVVQLSVTLAGYQGDSPHAGDAWYATDFGWDALRDALNAMTALAYPNDSDDNNPDPRWYSAGLETWTGTGQSFEGSWGEAKSDLAGDIEYEPEGTYNDTQIVRPGMEYEGQFSAFGPGSTQCLWTASFDSSRAPAYFDEPWVYPTNLAYTVTWYTEVITTTDDGVNEEAELNLIEVLSATSDGINPDAALTTEKAGGDELAGETAPSDPVNGPDVGTPNEDNEVQDNITRNRRTYSSTPIAIVRLTFTHREDP